MSPLGLTAGRAALWLLVLISIKRCYPVTAQAAAATCGAPAVSIAAEGAASSSSSKSSCARERESLQCQLYAQLAVTLCESLLLLASYPISGKMKSFFGSRSRHCHLERRLRLTCK